MPAANPLRCKGMLLVATPPLEDPNFDRTVVYMLEHHLDGAVGVVLNRPTGLDLPDNLERWAEHLRAPAVLFHGGPVETDALIALAVVDRPAADTWTAIDEDLGSIDLGLRPDDVAEAFRELRIFRGYAGWGPGQLDGELEAGSWMVFSAERSDIFCSEPAGLWRAVVRRQGGRTAWLANAPDDLHAN